MSAYLILNYDVHDPAGLDHYRQRAGVALLDRTEGALVAVTQHTSHLPEAGGGGTHTVILRYPDVEKAQAAYYSERYQRVLADRLTATTPRTAMIVPAL